MPQARYNLFGFGKKKKPAEKCARRSSMTIGQAISAAYKAGAESGDTGLFRDWLCQKGLDTRGQVLKDRLESAYTAGVEDEPNTEQKPAATYKGVPIYKLASGAYQVYDSEVDGMKEGKQFIDDQLGRHPRRRNITDRAHRYRAQRNIQGPQKCDLCGSKRFLVVDHRNGNESDDAPSNLRYLCKSCNTREGARMAREGIGRRTRQYNPGATNLAQYTLAVTEHVRGRHDAGGKIIHETPKALRRQFAKEIWDRRYSHGTAGGGDLPDWVTGNPASSWPKLPEIEHAEKMFDTATRELQEARERSREAKTPAQKAKAKHDLAGAKSFYSTWQRKLRELEDAERAWLNEKFHHREIRNPAKYDRCVKDVQAAGTADNAYAVCTAAGTRNPSKGPYRIEYRNLITGWMHSADRATLAGALKKAKAINRTGPAVRIIDAEGNEAAHLAGHHEPRIIHVNPSLAGAILAPQLAGSVDLAPRRRNSAQAAAEAYEGFHGAPSREQIEIVTTVHEHEHTWALGELIEMVVRYEDGAREYDVLLKGFKGALLDANEARNQMYVSGGDQSVDLAEFGIQSPIHESEDIGRCVMIAYHTVKKHLGKQGGDAIFYHCIENNARYEELARKYPSIGRPRLSKEQEGIGPTVIYDTRNKLLSFAGGTYTLPAEGIEY